MSRRQQTRQARGETFTSAARQEAQQIRRRAAQAAHEREAHAGMVPMYGPRAAATPEELERLRRIAREIRAARILGIEIPTWARTADGIRRKAGMPTGIVQGLYRSSCAPTTGARTATAPGEVWSGGRRVKSEV